MPVGGAAGWSTRRAAAPGLSTVRSCQPLLNAWVCSRPRREKGGRAGTCSLSSTSSWLRRMRPCRGPLLVAPLSGPSGPCPGVSPPSSPLERLLAQLRPSAAARHSAVRSARAPQTCAFPDVAPAATASQGQCQHRGPPPELHSAWACPVVRARCTHLQRQGLQQGAPAAQREPCGTVRAGGGRVHNRKAVVPRAPQNALQESHALDLGDAPAARHGAVGACCSGASPWKCT